MKKLIKLIEIEKLVELIKVEKLAKLLEIKKLIVLIMLIKFKNLKNYNTYIFINKTRVKKAKIAIIN